MLAKPGMDGKTRAALGQCQKLYNDVDFAFLRAHDTIKIATTGQVGLAISLAHRCDDVFAKAAIQSPLAQYSSYTVKIGIICVAITDLIK